MRSRIKQCARRGFTLVEILIVVIIIGILAAIVIPNFATASGTAAENTANSVVQTVQAQVELYRFKTSDYPATLTTLYDEGYLNSDPTTSMPEGYTLEYDNTTGHVTAQPVP